MLIKNYLSLHKHKYILYTIFLILGDGPIMLRASSAQQAIIDDGENNTGGNPHIEHNVVDNEEIPLPSSPIEDIRDVHPLLPVVPITITKKNGENDDHDDNSVSDQQSYNDHYEIEEEYFFAQTVNDPSMRRVLKRDYRRGRYERHTKRKNNIHNKKGRRRFPNRRCITSGVEVNLSEEDSIIPHEQRVQDGANSSDNDDGEENHQGLGETSWNIHKYGTILPASELGIEEESMYERLICILEGDDIAPEDYDLLLQLDSTNHRKTLEESELSKYPIIVIGEEEEIHEKLASSLSNCCEICLESWTDLQIGAEVRQLPCGHIFCRSCIDDWLKERSHKCPNLSCYWRLEQQEDDNK